MSQPSSRKPWLFIISGFLAGTVAGLGLLSLMGVLDLGSLMNRLKSGSTPAQASIEIGSPAPDFELHDLAGKRVRLADFIGELVVLNFWATWCAPCRTEMPEFQNIFQQNQPGLVILGINIEQEPDEIKQFVSPLGITYPILIDHQGTVSKLYRVIQLPNTYFIDRQGTIRFRHIGSLNSDQFHEYLQRIGVEE